MKSYLKRYWIEISVLTILVITLAISYVRFYTLNAFVSYDFVPCDTTLHRCFVSECVDEDPRCTPYMDEEGMYYFAIQEHKGNTITEQYCADDTKEALNNILLDPVCSE